MGTLRIQGLIDIAQFWPVGSSDADTTKIKLIVGKDSFKYKEKGSKSFKATKVYEGAKSKGTITSEVIKVKKKTGERTITVRLQGVDAPELHYSAAPLKQSPDITPAKRQKYNDINEERRQCFAESSTVALAKHLLQFADDDGIIKATFETEVDAPHDAVDTYGRFVGNIVVGKGKDINVWLVENGWGTPAFYTSMKADEIQTFLDAWEKGKKIAKRTSKAITNDVNKFDWDLIYRSPGSVDSFKQGEDKGKVLLPKIFRRQVAWMVAKKAGIGSKTKTFIQHLGNADELVLVTEYLDNNCDLNSTTTFKLKDRISAKNKFIDQPEDIAFKEKPGKLVNAKNKEITKW
jgi:endonuclease YncB( thermonuclease family)